MIHELFPEYFHDAKEVMAQKKEVITKASLDYCNYEKIQRKISVNILNIDHQKLTLSIMEQV